MSFATINKYILTYNDNTDAPSHVTFLVKLLNFDSETKGGVVEVNNITTDELSIDIVNIGGNYPQITINTIRTDTIEGNGSRTYNFTVGETAFEWFGYPIANNQEGHRFMKPLSVSILQALYNILTKTDGGLFPFTEDIEITLENISYETNQMLLTFSSSGFFESVNLPTITLFTNIHSTRSGCNGGMCTKQGNIISCITSQFNTPLEGNMFTLLCEFPLDRPEPYTKISSINSQDGRDIPVESPSLTPIIISSARYIINSNTGLDIEINYNNPNSEAQTVNFYYNNSEIMGGIAQPGKNTITIPASKNIFTEIYVLINNDTSTKSNVVNIYPRCLWNYNNQQGTVIKYKKGNEIKYISSIVKKEKDNE